MFDEGVWGLAKRTSKKPVSRRPARAAKPTGRLAAFGWLATAAVAGAWAISDGRPARYALTALDGLESKTIAPGRVKDRVVALIDTDRTPPPKPDRQEPGRAVPLPQERTGPLRPRTNPPGRDQTVQLRPTAAPIPFPVAAPMLPLDKPPLEFGLRQARPIPAGLVVSGGAERHATRSLPAHAAPDGSSVRVAEIDSGSSVTVLRSAGDWRYVRGTRSGAEGWVDGRFLAGESGGAPTASELATLAREDIPTHRP